MNQLLSENAAWAFLAAKLENYGNTELRSGLCLKISQLADGGLLDARKDSPIAWPLISPSTANAMRERLYEKAAREGVLTNSYIWPLSKRGRQARIAFCNRMTRITKAIHENERADLR